MSHIWRACQWLKCTWPGDDDADSEIEIDNEMSEAFMELEFWLGIPWCEFTEAWTVCAQCPGRNVVPRHLRKTEHKHIGSVVDGTTVVPREGLKPRERLLDAEGLPWEEFRLLYRICKYCRRIQPSRFPGHSCIFENETEDGSVSGRDDAEEKQ